MMGYEGRGWWRAAMIAALAIGAAIPAGGSRAARSEQVASLDPVQGLVQVHAIDAPADVWETTVERRLVSEGDWIRTDSRGHAYLTFFEGIDTEIYPNSLVQVSRFEVREDASFDLVMTVFVGDTIHNVQRALDARSRYEVVTPGATALVRGTRFWVQVLPTGVTHVTVFEGPLEVIGRSIDAPEASLRCEQAITVSLAGELSEVGPVTREPAAIPPSELAPITCGNGRCDPGENALCPLDCREFPACGNGRCSSRAQEDVVTCPQDCIFRNLPEDESRLHFYWGKMRCDFWPTPIVSGPLSMEWGIGCFDSADHASAHPDPAEYQLFVDGQAWNTSALRQEGPLVHLPDCPWGWTYYLDAVQFSPGAHELVLIETATDTWTSASGATNAGDTNMLTCWVTVLP